MGANKVSFRGVPEKYNRCLFLCHQDIIICFGKPKLSFGIRMTYFHDIVDLKILLYQN